jgi:arginyl-tRNA synthetase
LSEEIEFELVKQLAKFPNIISTAVVNYDPSELANYLYDLAKAFSLFYEKLPIIKAEPKVKKARLLLIDDVKIVLAQGLELLGIETPDKM